MRNEVGDGHPVIVVPDGQGQGRRAHIPVRIGQGVGEHFTPRRPARQRHKLRVCRVEGVGVGAVGIEHQAAVGPGQSARSHRRTIRPLHVVGNDVAGEGDAVFARRAIGVVHRRRYIIHYLHAQGVRRRVPIAVHQAHREVFKQAVVAIRRRVRLVVVQGVAVANTSCSGDNVEVNTCHNQLITQLAGDRLRESGDELAVADE